MVIINSYDPSAYKLKLYKELGCEGGYDVRLEILQKSTSLLFAQEIGYLAALSLSLEGNGEIDDPITKSSLQFSIIEESFKANNIAVRYNGFNEFFTPDSTAYLVVLKTRTSADEQWVDRWRGYITPDSWEEDLDSYGTITITARDNIGHLADIDFDYSSDSGMISIQGLITAAMSRIAMPMELRLNTGNEGDAMAVIGGDVDIMGAGICISALKGKTWLSAVEDVLASLGMTMRYTDDASVTVMHLANLPLYGSAKRKDAIDLLFHGGTKSLVPAYREIISECDYNAQTQLEIDVERGLQYGAQDTYTWAFKSTESSLLDGKGTGKITPIIGSREEGWLEGSRLMQPGVYGDLMADSESEEYANRPLIAANDSSGSTFAAYRMLVGNSAVSMRIKFGGGVTINNNGIMYYGFVGKLFTKIAIVLENNGTSKYWNGQRWGTAMTLLDFEGFDVEVELVGEELQPGASMTIYFDKVEFKGISSGSVLNGIYARLLSLDITANTQLLEKDTVKTINNEAYNVKAERALAFGAMSQQNMKAFSIDVYPNALWDMSSQGEFNYFPYYCYIGADYNNTYPLPALVHRQLLMFHHLAQPMLSGHCSVPYGARFDRLYHYKGTDYILQGATLDLFSGRMDITLRGFIAYNDLWD